MGCFLQNVIDHTSSCKWATDASNFWCEQTQAVSKEPDLFTEPMCRKFSNLSPRNHPQWSVDSPSSPPPPSRRFPRWHQRLCAPPLAFIAVVESIHDSNHPYLPYYLLFLSFDRQSVRNLCRSWLDLGSLAAAASSIADVDEVLAIEPIQRTSDEAHAITDLVFYQKPHWVTLFQILHWVTLFQILLTSRAQEMLIAQPRYFVK